MILNNILIYNHNCFYYFYCYVYTCSVSEKVKQNKQTNKPLKGAMLFALSCILCMLYDEVEHTVCVCGERDRKERKREALRHMGGVGERERGREDYMIYKFFILSSKNLVWSTSPILFSGI